MTPKQKCDDLLAKIGEVTTLPLDTGKDKSTLSCARLIVSEIEDALTNYGIASNELQNMDGEWRYWDAVKNEILKK